MASSQEPIQDLPSSVVQHNHIFIKYQQPPDLGVVNYILKVLIGVTRIFTQVPYIWGLHNPNSSSVTDPL